MTLEQKQAELTRIGKHYDDMSAAAFGPDVTPEQQAAFSRRLDALAPMINRLIHEIKTMGGDPGRAPEVLNNPTVKIDPLLDLFASGAIDDLYAPDPMQKKRQTDRSRFESLGYGLE